jgi:hypothetical protein
MTTPTRQAAPPRNARASGASLRIAQLSRIATGGARYVVAPMRPAVVLAKA